jgi:hypothetical protein
MDSLDTMGKNEERTAGKKAEASSHAKPVPVFSFPLFY